MVYILIKYIIAKLFFVIFFKQKILKYMITYYWIRYIYNTTHNVNNFIIFI